MLPAATGVPSGRPVAAAASRLTAPHSSWRPDQPGQRQPRGDRLRPLVDPGVGVDVVERRPVAGAVVVEDVLAGEARDEVGARAEDAPGRRPHLRLLVGEPADLGSRRLARQPRAAAGEDLVRAQLGGQPLDLRARPRVDPVQDRGPQRPPARVGREDARAEGAHAHGPHARGAPGEHAAARLDRAAPPVAFGVLLRPARPRPRDAVLQPRVGDHHAVGADEHRFGARRADVEAQVQVLRHRITHPWLAETARVTPPRRSRGRACRRT